MPDWVFLAAFYVIVFLVGFALVFDMYFDRIPSVIYVWDEKYEEETVVFYTNSYRRAKKIQAQFEKNNEGLTFGITEAWHNPNIRRMRE